MVRGAGAFCSGVADGSAVVVMQRKRVFVVVVVTAGVVTGVCGGRAVAGVLPVVVLKAGVAVAVVMEWGEQAVAAGRWWLCGGGDGDGTGEFKALMPLIQSIFLTRLHRRFPAPRI